MKRLVIFILAVMILGSLIYTLNMTYNYSGADNSNLSLTLPAQAKQPAKAPAAESKKYIVYYFYGNNRCPSCKKIEAYTDETVKQKFADALKKGTLTWQTVNTDEPPNKHFTTDYQLYTKSVVVVEMKNGKQTRWKNLDKIWEKLGNKSNFCSYVESEINGFMRGQ